jgi:DNA-binding transcriptional ArsR family regulator
MSRFWRKESLEMANGSPNIAKAAALIADPKRALMLDVLLDGEAHTASELAKEAKISAQTASSHLTKMVEGQLLTVEKVGRYRFYRLANERVAHALEVLSLIGQPTEIRSLSEYERTAHLKLARTCYDHLAGKLGVQLTETFLVRGYLQDREEKDFTLTETGETFLQEWGIEREALALKRRFFARKCLDWSEKRHHVAGALGAAIAHHFIQQKWVKRQQGNRSLTITREGEKALQYYFQLDPKQWG